MIPYELTLCNFMCYRGDPPPLRLDGLHIACLSGENGAGKSALLDAITWALWGKARMSDDELIAQGESEMQVDLQFVLNDHYYRVIRRRQRGKVTRSGRTSSGKSFLDLQVRNGQNWRAIGENTISETQSKIDSLLHMKYETFINASFLLQGRADEFTRRTPGERKQVLADILDLREYDRLEERARQRVKQHKEQITALDGAIELLQQEADKLPMYARFVEEAGEKVARLTTDLSAAEEAQRQADEQVRALEAKSARRTAVQERLHTLRESQRQHQQEIAGLQQAISEDEAVLQRQAEIQTGVATLAAAQQELARLEELRPRYDALQEQRRQHQDALKDELRKLHSDLDMHRREVQRLQKQSAHRPTVQAALSELEQRMADLAPLVKQQEALREQRRHLDERTSRVNSLLLRHNELTGAIKQQHDRLTAMREEEKRTIARLKKQLRDAERWQADLETARAQQQTTADLSAQLATLRERDQSTTEQVGKLRALCESLKGQAEHMKQRKAMITDEATTTCPLCGSHLGTEGVASVLSHYDRDLETMRQQYRQARDEADNLEQDLSRLREEVRQRDAEVEQARRGAARVETLQQQLAGATEAQQELDEAQTKLADVERQLAEQDYERVAREALLTVEAELTELLAEPEPRKGGGWTAAPAALERERKALERQQSSLEKQLATRPDIESEAAARRRELAELEQAAGALPAAEESVAALSSTIERGDFAHEVRQAEQVVEAEMGSLGYSTEGHTAARTRAQELAHWTNEQHRLELARSRQENHQRMLHLHTDALEHCSTELDTLQTEEAQLALDVRALPEATQRAAECGRAAQACSTALRAAQNDQVEKQSWHRRAQEAAQQLAQKQAERQAFAERQGVFQELAEACGKKGVQAMLIETAIPEIEREANRLLGRITNNQMHVTFEMQRSTKKGDQVETLEIKIADSLGTRSYDSFSGGETTRINFAIRIALSRLLAGRAGASLETLVIDEGMSALDADGRERFVEAVTSVQHDFKRILVITHLDELKDRFPARIEVTKTAAGSTWALL